MSRHHIVDLDTNSRLLVIFREMHVSGFSFLSPTQRPIYCHGYHVSTTRDCVRDVYDMQNDIDTNSTSSTFLKKKIPIVTDFSVWDTHVPRRAFPVAVDNFLPVSCIWHSDPLSFISPQVVSSKSLSEFLKLNPSRIIVGYI